MKKKFDFHYYKFNESGFILEKLILTADGRYYGNDTFEYQADGKLIISKHFLNLTRTSSKVYCGKTVFDYDNKGNLIEELKYFWGILPDTNKIQKKTIFKYDNESRLIEKIELRYNSFIGNYEELYKYNFKYAKNKLIGEDKYLKDFNGNWVKEKKFYVYDNEGNLVKIKEYDRNNELELTIIFEYDSNGLLLKKTFIPQNFPNNTWIISYQYDYYTK